MKKAILIILSIFLLLILIFSNIYNYGASTSTVIYKKGNHKIKLIGTLHTGTLNYWGSMFRELAEKKIIIEAVELGKGLDSIMEPYSRLSEYMHSRYQGDILNCTNFIIVDSSFNEILQYYPMEKINEFSKQVESFKNVNYRMTRFIFGVLAAYSYFFEKNDPLVYNRNEKPVIYAIKEKADIIVYGEIHIYGMCELLESQGYKKISGIKNGYIFK